MKEPITKKSLKKLPVVPYDIVRNDIKTGDIFFSSGSYLFSGIIQRLTRSTWSHVAVVYKDQELGRVLILEAEPYVGIRLIPLSKYLKNYNGTGKRYKGQVVIAQMKEPVEKAMLDKGISFGLDELTRPYDNYEILRIMIRILFRISKRERNRSYICSELVRAVFAKSGVNFKLRDTYISPDNIWNDERVEMRWRVL
ncbi:MAG: YiiX/YebB-like N1pC/P60 family cysteine hydrolase [Ferruginibacter sp.]